MGTRRLLGVVLFGALTLGACSNPDVAPPTPAVAATTPPPPPAPSSALLAVASIPTTATEVRVTDFAAIKDDLEIPDLNSTSPAAQRAEFWRFVTEESPALTEGLLRPVDDQLRTTYAFTQDDVVWEARFETPEGSGWILQFGEDVEMTDVERAVQDGVGELADGIVDAGAGRVALRAVAPSQSLGADSDLEALVSMRGIATYLSSACAQIPTALAVPVAQLPVAVAETFAAVQPLDTFSITFGPNLATVRLGEGRTDLESRLELATPPTAGPAFAAAYLGGVVDAQSGRIGFDLGDPVLAAQLATQRRLPFAVCPAP